MSNRRPDLPRGGLTRAIVLWRVGHGLITTGFLAAIAAIWSAALTGRRGPGLRVAIAALVGECVVSR